MPPKKKKTISTPASQKSSQSSQIISQTSSAEQNVKEDHRVLLNHQSLFNQCKNNNVSSVKKFLTKHPDLSSRALMFAFLFSSAHEDNQISTLIMSHKNFCANAVSTVIDAYVNPLHNACERGNVKLVEKLLTFPELEINNLDHKNTSPLDMLLQFINSNRPENQALKPSFIQIATLLLNDARLPASEKVRYQHLFEGIVEAITVGIKKPSLNEVFETQLNTNQPLLLIITTINSPGFDINGLNNAGETPLLSLLSHTITKQDLSFLKAATLILKKPSVDITLQADVLLAKLISIHVLILSLPESQENLNAFTEQLRKVIANLTEAQQEKSSVSTMTEISSWCELSTEGKKSIQSLSHSKTPDSSEQNNLKQIDHSESDEYNFSKHTITLPSHEPSPPEGTIESLKITEELPIKSFYVSPTPLLPPPHTHQLQGHENLEKGEHAPITTEVFNMPLERILNEDMPPENNDELVRNYLKQQLSDFDQWEEETQEDVIDEYNKLRSSLTFKEKELPKFIEYWQNFIHFKENMLGKMR